MSHEYRDLIDDDWCQPDYIQIINDGAQARHDNKQCPYDHYDARYHWWMSGWYGVAATVCLTEAYDRA